MENSYSQQDIEMLKNRAEAGDAESQELWGMALQYGDGVEGIMKRQVAGINELRNKDCHSAKARWGGIISREIQSSSRIWKRVFPY